MLGSLVGRTALVTGSTRGVGNAIARRLAAEGARVVVHGRDPENVDRVVDSIAGSVGVVCDIADPVGVESMCARAADAVGPIEIVVNNAGTSRHSLFLDGTDAEWDRILAVNLLGPRNVLRALLPGMRRAGWGRVVNVTSEAGVRGTAGYSAYAASKGALVALSLTLALELADTGIHVNSFAPIALTDLVRSQVTPRELEYLTRRGMPTVDECADALVPLVGNDAPTGAVVLMQLGGQAPEVIKELPTA